MIFFHSLFFFPLFFIKSNETFYTLQLQTEESKRSNPKISYILKINRRWCYFSDVPLRKVFSTAETGELRSTVNFYFLFLY